MPGRRFIPFLAMLTAGIIFSGSVLAADITIKVDKEKKIADISSSLATEVTLLYLVSNDQRRLPLFGRIERGKSVKVPLRFTVPQSVSYGTCEITDPPKEYQQEDDRYYHLSVEIL